MESEINTQKINIDPNEFIQEYFIPYDINKDEDILEKLKRLSHYLRELTNLEEVAYQSKLFEIFVTISKNKYLKKRDIEFDIITAYILCSFADIMRLTAPKEDLFDSETLKFYLLMFKQWLLNFEETALKNEEYKDTYEHIIYSFGETNILFFQNRLQLDNYIPAIIDQLFNIQNQMEYSLDSTTGKYISEIIISSLGELENVPNIVTPKLLKFLSNKQKKGCQDLAKNVISNLSKELSDYIRNIVISDELNVKGKDYSRLLKYLARINIEYLILFFQNVPSNSEYLIKTEINGISYRNILLKVFSIENSLEIIKRYKSIFYTLIDSFSYFTKFHFDNMMKYIKTFAKVLYLNKTLLMIFKK